LFPDYNFPANYVVVDDHRIHYLDEGVGDVVVMVHGNPTWSYFFRNLVLSLRKSHRVIVIDHIGCGLSDKPQSYNYSLNNHIENLEHLLAHLEIKMFSLIVHDWGGAIGMGVAVKRVAAIEKIVIMNTAAFRSKRIPFRIQICKIPVLGEVIVRLFNGFAWPATFMAVEKKMPPRVAKAYLAPYNTWKNRIATHRFVKDIPLQSTHQSYSTLQKIEEGLHQFKDSKIPMMLLWGGKDFCFNDTFYNEWVERFPEIKQHYFKDAGHYLLEDEPEQIRALVTDFFS
jgi:pimeloyl-ACP methyl ester carboxylesterase